jgi:hypothetical protein
MNNKVKFDKKTGTRIYNSNGYLNLKFTDNSTILEFIDIDRNDSYTFPIIEALSNIYISHVEINKLLNEGHLVSKDFEIIIEAYVVDNKQIYFAIYNLNTNIYNDIKGRKLEFYVDYYIFYSYFARRKNTKLLCRQREYRPVIKYLGNSIDKLRKEFPWEYRLLVKKINSLKTWECSEIKLYDGWEFGDLYAIFWHTNIITSQKIKGLEMGIIWHRDFSKKAGGYYSTHT